MSWDYDVSHFLTTTILDQPTRVFRCVGPLEEEINVFVLVQSAWKCPLENVSACLWVRGTCWIERNSMNSQMVTELEGSIALQQVYFCCVCCESISALTDGLQYASGNPVWKNSANQRNKNSKFKCQDGRRWSFYPHAMTLWITEQSKIKNKENTKRKSELGNSTEND